jgi:putative spermidine/putrescine transport system substrate-binding protein
MFMRKKDIASRSTSRRRFLVSVSAALSSGVAIPSFIFNDAIASTKELYVNTWGGSWTEAEKDAFFEPFTKATGVAIRPVSPVAFAKLRAQVQSGSYEFDITELPQTDWLIADKMGFAEPINWKVVEKAKIPETAVLGPSIGFCTLATMIAFRKEAFPNGGPQSWADFWNVKKFPGKRSLCSAVPVQLIPLALLADGVPKEKLYPLDIDRAFKKLDEIKPYITVWWTGGAQSQQLLRDRQVDITSIWSARGLELQQQGTAVDLVWDEALIHTTSWGVVKGTPNSEVAWRFIQSAVQPEAQGIFAKRLFYAPSNPEALKLLPENVAVQMPTHPRNLSRGVMEDPVWGAENNFALRERFRQWLAS